MKSNFRSRRPVLEQLESRNLLSTGLRGVSASAIVAQPAAQQKIALSGTFRGRFVDSDKIPDVGSTFSPTGSGHVSRLGDFSLSGEIQTIGFIQFGPIRGTIVLKGASGTLALQLTALERGSGTLGLPRDYNYSVVRGTGRYTQVKDSGTATLTTVVSQVPSHSFGVQYGRFKLVLNSAS